VFDGNFLAVMLLKLKQDPVESVRRVLGSECEFIVPNAVLNELRMLASNKKEFQVVVNYAQKFARKEYYLNSKDGTLTAAECLKEIVGGDNASKLFVCTQDNELRSHLRSVGGIPLLYANRTMVLFEQPSFQSKKGGERSESQKTILSQSEKQRKKSAVKIIKELSENSEGGSSSSSAPKPQGSRPQKGMRIKRKAKGPNPLANKKSKKVKAVSAIDVQYIAQCNAKHSTVQSVACSVHVVLFLFHPLWGLVVCLLSSHCQSLVGCCSRQVHRRQSGSESRSVWY
jgi:U3 small nucleolar RNA-associated protein 23